MRDILLIAVGGYIGWYLALNEKEATLQALTQAKNEALKLKDQLTQEIKTNENLNTILEGINIRQGVDGSKTRPRPRPMPRPRPTPRPMPRPRPMLRPKR